MGIRLSKMKNLANRPLNFGHLAIAKCPRLAPIARPVWAGAGGDFILFITEGLSKARHAACIPPCRFLFCRDFPTLILRRRYAGGVCRATSDPDSSITTILKNIGKAPALRD